MNYGRLKNVSLSIQLRHETPAQLNCSIKANAWVSNASIWALHVFHVPFSKPLPVAQVSFLFNNGNFCSPGQGLALLVTCSVKWENLCLLWLAYVSVNAHDPFSSKWPLNFHLVYCWWHYMFWPQDIEKSSWYWLGSFLQAVSLSWYWEVLCRLVGEKRD